MTMKNDKIKEPPKMLVATVNCSIGDKNNHLKAEQIIALLNGKPQETIFEKYAIKTIKIEALQYEIDTFIGYYQIPKEKAYKIIYG